MQLGGSWVCKWWQRDLLILCLFTVLGTAVYWNSLDNPFVYDDNMYVVTNQNIRFVENIPRFFVNPRLSTNVSRNAGHYRPLVVTSYAINYAIGGLSPVGYHLVNLAFHVGSAFLIFLIVSAMLGGSYNLPAELAAGLIFLIHPFNAEAVNYITARSSVMSGFFYLLAFCCWVMYRQAAGVTPTPETSSGRVPSLPRLSYQKGGGRQGGGRKVGGDSSATCPVDRPEGLSLRFIGGLSLLPPAAAYYIGSLLAFIAGMLSKEVVITLPIVLWLYDIYFGPNYERRLKPAATQRSYFFDWRTYLPYLPFVLVVVIPYLAVRLLKFGKVLPHFRRDIVTQVVIEIPVLVKHWNMFLWPGGLSLVHDVDVSFQSLFPLLLSGLLLMAGIGIACYLYRLSRKEWRIGSFFMIWFFVVLLPTTIIPLNAIFQENRGYLAIVSFAALAGVFLNVIGESRFSRWNTGLIVLLLLAYSAATIHRNTLWDDKMRLWKDAVVKAPGSAAAYTGLANTYRERGDLLLSLETAKKGVAIDPENYYLRINLGRTYQLLGDMDRAIQEYEWALKSDPGRATIWYELALLYGKKGEIERTERYLREAVRLWNDFPPFHYNLSMVLRERGKLAESVDGFRRAIALYPEYVRARYELGVTYERLGRSGEAEREYREVARMASHTPGDRLFLYGQDREKVERALEEARERLVLKRGGR